MGKNHQRQNWGKSAKGMQKPHLLNTKLSCQTSLKKWKLKMWKRSFRARRPSKSESGSCENEAFVRHVPQKLKVEDVKTKLSCETSPKIWKLKKMWKRNKTKLSCETSLKKWKWKMWKRSFCARHPSNSKAQVVQNDAWNGSWNAGAMRAWSAPNRACSATVARQTFPIHLPRHVLSCKLQHVVHPLSLKEFKGAFRARRPSKSEHWRCENEAVARDFLQNLNVKLLLHPFALTLGCCDIPLLCHPTALTSLCFGIPLLWHPFALTSHCFDIPLLWHSFALTSLCCDIPLLIPLLWHPFALTSRCFDIPLLWHPVALTSHCFDIPLLWHPFAVTSHCFAFHCFDIPLLWRPFAVTFQRSVTRKLDFQTFFDQAARALLGRRWTQLNTAFFCFKAWVATVTRQMCGRWCVLGLCLATELRLMRSWLLLLMLQSVGARAFEIPEWGGALHWVPEGCIGLCDSVHLSYESQPDKLASCWTDKLASCFLRM